MAEQPWPSGTRAAPSEASALVQQEMSNLKALKRLSIGATLSPLDPDLPGPLPGQTSPGGPPGSDGQPPRSPPSPSGFTRPGSPPSPRYRRRSSLGTSGLSANGNFNNSTSPSKSPTRGTTHRKSQLYDVGEDSVPLSPTQKPNNENWDTPQADTTSSPSSSANIDKLLWVPAHVHPELAPNEWRSFVQEKLSEISDKKQAQADPSKSPPPSSRLSRVVSDQDQYVDASELLDKRRRSSQGTDVDKRRSILELSEQLQQLGELESLATTPVDDDRPIPQPERQLTGGATSLRRSSHSTRRPRPRRSRAALRDTSPSGAFDSDASSVTSVSSAPATNTIIATDPELTPLSGLRISTSSAALASASATSDQPPSPSTAAPSPGASELLGYRRYRPNKVGPSVAEKPSRAETRFGASISDPSTSSHPIESSRPRTPEPEPTPDFERVREPTPEPEPESVSSERERGHEQEWTKWSHDPQTPVQSQSFALAQAQAQAEAEQRQLEMRQAQQRHAEQREAEQRESEQRQAPFRVDITTQPLDIDSKNRDKSKKHGHEDKSEKRWRWIDSSSSPHSQKESLGGGFTSFFKSKKDKDKDKEKDKDRSKRDKDREHEARAAKQRERERERHLEQEREREKEREREREKEREKERERERERLKKKKTHGISKRGHSRNVSRTSNISSDSDNHRDGPSREGHSREESRDSVWSIKSNGEHAEQSYETSGAVSRQEETNGSPAIKLPYDIPAHQISDRSYIMMYHRFPLHIERAIYRLSHMKLANPRRPLHQQVLLSNFMYAYLNLINQGYQQQIMAQKNGTTPQTLGASSPHVPESSQSSSSGSDNLAETQDRNKIEQLEYEQLAQLQRMEYQNMSNMMQAGASDDDSSSSSSDSEHEWEHEWSGRSMQ